MRIGGIDGFPLTLDLQGQDFGAFRLELVGRGHLQFNEFEAWSVVDGELTNVALKRPARQSSIAVKGHGPHGGNSGRVHADIGAITETEDQAWWEVELGSLRPVSHINLFNRMVFRPAANDRLRVLGRRGGEWISLFDPQSAADVASVLSTRLLRDSRRIESVLAHACTPRLSRVGTDDTAIEHEVLGSWHEINQQAMLADVLQGAAETLDANGVAISNGVLRILRSAAKLAMPTTLVSRTAHTRIIATSDLDRLALYTFDAANDAPVLAVRSCDVELDRSFPDAVASNVADHWSPRMQSVDEWDTPDDVYFVDLDAASSKYAKWELRGQRVDGSTVLVYDSLGLSGSALGLLQVVRRLGLADFETMDSILAGLELEGRTVSAIATSRWFDVDDPGLSRFERSLQEIELRSALDEWRKPVSRTKHGYKTTHRFMDPIGYAKGTARLLDIVGAHPEFAHIFAAFGTLLGFVREDGFIPHDDDSDLVVVTNAQSKEEMMELRETLRSHLESETNFRLFDGSKLPGRNLPVGFSEDGQWVHIDLFLTFYEEGNLMIFNDRTKSFDPIDPDLLRLGRETTIHGVQFNIPERSEELLELWYGPNWSTPMTSYLLGYSWQQN